MRPPYLNANSAALAVLKKLQYKVITIDLDTFDWQNNKPETIQKSVKLYQDGLNATPQGTISLSHDTLPDTVDTLAPAMIAAILAKGKKCE